MSWLFYIPSTLILFALIYKLSQSWRTFNSLSTQDEEAGRVFVSSRPAWSTKLYSKTLFQKIIIKQNTKGKLLSFPSSLFAKPNVSTGLSVTNIFLGYFPYCPQAKKVLLLFSDVPLKLSIFPLQLGAVRETVVK